MSAKGLGQIHTVNQNLELPLSVAVNNPWLVDLSQELSTQLERNIRQGQYYKIVGIDMTLDTPELDPGGDESSKGTVKGRLRYFAPTRGRCAAYRLAFKQMMEQMKNQGISVRDNHLYDFRVLPRAHSNYTTSLTQNPVFNLATLNGVDLLALVENGGAEFELFTNHNETVEPVVTTTPNFPSGLETQQGRVHGQSDFVLEEGLIQSGNSEFANTEFEEIPFVLAWDIDNEQAVSLQWRPDPALYLAVMCGQFEIIFDEVAADGATIPAFDGIEVNVAFHIAGWKSIMGDPDKKRHRKAAKKPTVSKKA